MKCPCGYSGIPTVHIDADPKAPHPAFAAHPHRWKCPACHGPRPADLRHDWMHDPDATDALVFHCSQCGMRAESDTEDRTACPGHPPGTHGARYAFCACGEWGPDPGPHPKTAPCKRCGEQYPYYNPADAIGKRDARRVAELERQVAELRDLLLKTGREEAQ